MPIKYLSGESSGVTLTVYETRSVIVSDEALSPTSAYEGDTVIYTATVKDDAGETLPSSFKVNLVINGITVISDQELTSDVYNSSTGELTLAFTVPEIGAGTYTVKLTWETQTI